MSGDGAAIHGARFNPNGIPTLYLALGIMTAVKEANQGFAHRIDPCVLCSYDVDCKDIVDLRTPADRAAAEVEYDDMACAWIFWPRASGHRPGPSTSGLSGKARPGSWCQALRPARKKPTRTWCSGPGASIRRTR
jgi:RES domain-containing protein